MVAREKFHVIRLQPDTKAAESLSRRLWKGKAKSGDIRRTAGRKVYSVPEVKSEREAS